MTEVRLTKQTASVLVSTAYEKDEEEEEDESAILMAYVNEMGGEGGRNKGMN